MRHATRRYSDTAASSVTAGAGGSVASSDVVLDLTRKNVAAEKAKSQPNKWLHWTLSILGALLLAAALTFLVATTVTAPMAPLIVSMGAWYLGALPFQAGAALLAAAGVAGLCSLLVGFFQLTKARINSDAAAGKLADRDEFRLPGAAAPGVSNPLNVLQQAPAMAPAPVKRPLPSLPPPGVTLSGNPHSLLSAAVPSPGSEVPAQDEAAGDLPLHSPRRMASAGALR